MVALNRNKKTDLRRGLKFS